MKLKYSNIGFTPKEINEENNTIRAIFSTDDVDRHGEVVDQKSWHLDDFMKNPVVLFGHDHHQPPVGKVIGLGYNGDGDLEGEIQFAAKQYPFANVLWNLYKDGFMKAFSVGFSSGNVDVVDEQVILKNNTLFEISTVSVPANAMALAKNKGLDTDPLAEALAKQLEETLDESVEDEEKEKDCPGCNQPPIKAESEEAETTEEEIVEESTEEKTHDEKGEVADEVEDIDTMEKKWENMDPVHEIFSAFHRVYFDDETPLDDFAKLLTETGELFIAHAKDGDAAKAEVAEFIKDNDEKQIEALKKVFQDVEVIVEETSATEDEVIDTTEKSIGDIIEDVKAGKVLSKSNRSKVEGAMEALQKVLDADAPKEEDKTISDDNTDEFIKVETPAVRVSVAKKAPNKNKAINKAIRALLDEKSK